MYRYHLVWTQDLTGVAFASSLQSKDGLKFQGVEVMRIASQTLANVIARATASIKMAAIW